MNALEHTQSKLRWTFGTQEKNAFRAVLRALEDQLEDWLGQKLNVIGHSPAIELALAHALMSVMASVRGDVTQIGELVSGFRTKPSMGYFRDRDLQKLERYRV